MTNRLFSIFFLAVFICLFSCKTSKPLLSRTNPSASSFEPSQSVSAYISSYKDLAISEMSRSGIPASITLAQGIIESDCGHSTLASEGNNHFGIKCHDNWSGSTIHHNDNKRNECFRKYNRPEESFYDHSDFLKSVSRYSFLFKIDRSDYKAWAYGLKKAGYATNPDYANMLIRTIEENNLWTLDQENIASAGKPNVLPGEQRVIQSVDTTKRTIQTSFRSNPVMAKVPRVMENNRIQYIIVKDGDTREKLENEFQLLKWELPKYNELTNDFVPSAGQILYLQPKRDRAEPGKEYYKAAEGDTMYQISQQYGIKVRKLYEMNRMAGGTEPQAGRKIWLRSTKPVD